MMQHEKKEKNEGRMWWITTLSTQRLSATIILLWWDFLWELCNNNASTQISTRLFCFFSLFSPSLLLRLLCSALSSQTAPSTSQHRSWNVC